VDPKNPFLILRLPANATAAEIKRAGQMALAAARLDSDSAANSASRLREVEDAIEKLRDPIERLKRGLEWPSLSPAGAAFLRENATFAALAHNARVDCGSDVDVLVATESAHDQSHARAVFNLLRAHALLRSRIDTPGRRGLEAHWELTTATKLLDEGLNQWATAIGMREFWLEQRLRAKALGDPRIDAAMMRDLEAKTLGAPLDRFAGIAQDSMRGRDAESCKKIVQTLRASRLPTEQIDDALGAIYTPTCARASSAIDALSAALNEEKSSNAQPYQALLRRYEQEVGPDIDMILDIGDLPGFSEEILRDKSSEFLRIIAVKAANNARAFDVSTAALAIAARAANSPTLRAKAEEDQATVRKLASEADQLRRIQPHATALQQAIDRDDYRSALAAIDQLISLESPENVQHLREMRRRLTTRWATELFNEGVQRANGGNFASAIALLEQALAIETVASERQTIEHALSRFRQLAAVSRPTAPSTPARSLTGASAGPQRAGFDSPFAAGRQAAAAKDSAKSGCLIFIVATLLLSGTAVAATFDPRLASAVCALLGNLLEGVL